MFKNRKNNLDEMQEQQLLHIESQGYYIAFWGLALSMIIQMIIYGFEDGPKYVAGEWIVFMILCVYVSFRCSKAGIWDRKLVPSFKDNLLMSLLSCLAVTVITFLIVWKRYPDKIIGSIASGIFLGVFVFFACFIALTISAESVKKKQAQLEAEPEPEEDEE